MNKAFSARMTELRRERGISQKDAAAALGVSQALLSHYEKGIRECGLDFLCNAAAFYDVSCDYLLGMARERRSFEETFDPLDVAGDAEFRTSTLFRAAAMLHDSLAGSGTGNGETVKHYYSLAIYRVAAFAAEQGFIPKEWVSLPYASASALCKAKMDMLHSDINLAEKPKKPKGQAEPLCVKTIISDAENILRGDAEKIINNFHT